MRFTDPVGYFITFTCYGNWLHGDERGSVDHSLAARGWPRVNVDPVVVEAMRKKLAQPPFMLDAAARGIVDATIREVCVHRDWALTALNVRTNHLHVVLTAACGPEKVMGDFKAWCTRRLREHGLASKDRRVWTDGGSTRYLWTDDDRSAAVDYVVNGQGADLEMDVPTNRPRR